MPGGKVAFHMPAFDCCQWCRDETSVDMTSSSEVKDVFISLPFQEFSW